MTNGVLYFVKQEGTGTAIASLEQLHPKTLARSLAFIDLLEESELPRDIDKPLGAKSTADSVETSGRKSNKNEAHSCLRAIKAKMGLTKLRFAYTRIDGCAVVLGAGEQIKGQGFAKLVQDFERAISPKTRSEKVCKVLPLKSHRELVAELTLSDPILAAHYTKARERAQFALSLIRLRDNAKFTNETLAQRTGLSLKLVTSLTRGRLPKLATMRRLADALQARVVIGPAGGIILEAHEPLEIPAKRFNTVEPVRSPIQPESPITAELLLVQ